MSARQIADAHVVTVIRPVPLPRAEWKTDESALLSVVTVNAGSYEIP